MREFLIPAVILIISNFIFAQSSEPGLMKIPDHPTHLYDNELNDGGSLIKSETRQVWDTASEVWKNDSLYTYLYNGEGLRDTLLFQKWNNHWDDQTKRVYFYSNSKLYEERLYMFWGGWVYYARDNYFYTSNNLTEHDIYLWWGGNTFMPVNRLTYQYNENNQVVNYLAEAYDDFYGVWYDAWMIDYSYDVLYRLTETVEYQGQIDLALHYRDLYSYDSLSNNYEDVGQYPEGSGWYNDYLFTYEIDQDSFLTRKTYMLWDSAGSAWSNVWRQSYSYNGSGNISSVLKEVWTDSIKWQNSRKRIVMYDGEERWIEDIRYVWNDTGWVNNIRYSAVWMDPVSVNDGTTAGEGFSLLQNYPNPFNPTTTIGFSIKQKANVRIIILNAIGEQVAVVLNEEKESGYHQVEFNAADLPSGVYLYQLSAAPAGGQAGNFIQTKKMILLR